MAFAWPDRCRRSDVVWETSLDQLILALPTRACFPMPADALREIGYGLSELKEGSGLILDSVSSLKENSTRVSKSSCEMAQLTGSVDQSMKSVEEVSSDTKRAAEEMRDGADRVNQVSRKMADQNRSLEEASSSIVSGMNKFKF